MFARNSDPTISPIDRSWRETLKPQRTPRRWPSPKMGTRSTWVNFEVAPGRQVLLRRQLPVKIAGKQASLQAELRGCGTLKIATSSTINSKKIKLPLSISITWWYIIWMLIKFDTLYCLMMPRPLWYCILELLFPTGVGANNLLCQISFFVGWFWRVGGGLMPKIVKGNRTCN